MYKLFICEKASLMIDITKTANKAISLSLHVHICVCGSNSEKWVRNQMFLRVTERGVVRTRLDRSRPTVSGDKRACISLFVFFWVSLTSFAEYLEIFGFAPENMITLDFKVFFSSAYFVCDELAG